MESQIVIQLRQIKWLLMAIFVALVPSVLWVLLVVGIAWLLVQVKNHWFDRLSTLFNDYRWAWFGKKEQTTVGLSG